MAKSAEFFKPTCLTFAQQIGRMSGTHPGFDVVLRRNRATWTGDLQPTAISELYKVRIEYKLGARPLVWVTRPQLRTRCAEEKIPHTFSNGSVCLHMQGEWAPHIPISDSIVPWLSLWLLHYEAWHATGQWHGGGHTAEGSK